jgi:acetyltransferase
LVTAMLDWARGRGIGFSQFVSLGEHADVDFGDMLDWLASDARTRAVLLYVESISAPRKFLSAARAAARNKPVLVVKAGRSLAGARAAASHTGALACPDAVFEAAIRRAGMLRVDTLQELFSAAELLSQFRSPPRHAGADASHERLTILTNGGGAGVMAADAAATAGVELATLPPEVMQALDTALPAHWPRANPVDIIGDAPMERYVAALSALLASPQAGTVLVMHAPTAVVSSAAIATALLPLLQAPAAAARVLGCWLGGPAVVAARQTFQAAGVPCFDTPEAAVRALALRLAYRRNQDELLQAPPDEALAQLDSARLRVLIDNALSQGRSWLNEREVHAVLQACGVPVVPSRAVKASPRAAARAAAELGFPVVIKIHSPDVLHKSDVGGVVGTGGELGDEAAVERAGRAMLRRVRQLRPGARIEGFTVQPWVHRTLAQELIAGAHVDALFGPVILFGQGGTAVEVLADRALALPPLNEPLARALVARTRISRLLAGWRDVPAANAHAVHRVLCAISTLLSQVPEVAELDINPLLADSEGVLALDARIRVDARRPAGAAHFAIRPYPAELVEQLPWQGRVLTLRPIRPEDEARHLAFLEKLDPQDIRMRIFYSRRSIERSELARLTQIDYEREMALLATAPDDHGDEETLGVVRAVTDPNNAEAEFGIVVRSDMKGRGLGSLLMHKLIDYQRRRGTTALVATVLRENTGMLGLMQRLGFTEREARLGAGAEVDADTVAIALPLLGGPG